MGRDRQARQGVDREQTSSLSQRWLKRLVDARNDGMEDFRIDRLFADSCEGRSASTSGTILSIFYIGTVDTTPPLSTAVYVLFLDGIASMIFRPIS
jgi:hypothetical protein